MAKRTVTTTSDYEFPEEDALRLAMIDYEILRTLVDARDRIFQKGRIGFQGRLAAIEQGRDSASTETQAQLLDWLDKLQGLEDEATLQIQAIAKTVPIIQMMVNVKGVGLTLASKVISMIDINRADTVSALWRYCGYSVMIDENGVGRREYPTKGEKLHYNSRLKSACYLVGQSFIKCNSPYRNIYDSAKEYYTVNRPDWSKMHCHNAAIRKMIKVWLQHLWVTWRTIEGLPTPEMYVHEKLGHTSYFSPQEFGWPEP